MNQKADKSFDERLSGRLSPTVGGSTYVRPQEMDWKPSQFEGVEIKVLYEDKEAGEMTCLLRWQPGTTLPMHRHADLEQSYVLAGSFSDHDGIAHAGEYVWRKKDSLHETHSAEGCIILAIYRKPNIFRNSAGFDPATRKQIKTQRAPVTKQEK
ncbi:anti-Sigm factor, ChrR [Herbaspirillum hiltneri N3]|uniref:Anti-Sigm factor, ChrR n=1 Tax=Herbaspirillum hiltneri N3 TaxID=1262470 RepID=A0ABN4I5B7_9BURK|nr:cupin domain-containing protein [Herbaspirillum hiltneri]AKZ64683.1 anti-Sigm factor, ChrR [Herbaspirillum hiltneri N3]